MTAWEERTLLVIRHHDGQLLDRILVGAIVTMQSTGRGW